MTPREIEEYRALRATIRERGTAPGLDLCWPGCGLGGADHRDRRPGRTPVATLLPLLVLAATFEIVFALHTGVERVGRYIQVFYESESATRLGTHGDGLRPAVSAAAASDPLFAVYFWVATVLNFIPAR